ncbi:MAG: vWA domain-containing protein [Acidimicrobiales bacterium]
MADGGGSGPPGGGVLKSNSVNSRPGAELAAWLAVALRAEGVAVSPERAARLVPALGLLQPLDRERLYWAARLTLLTGREQLGVFDAVFGALFGGAVGVVAATEAPVAAEEAGNQPPAAGGRPLGAAGCLPAQGRDMFTRAPIAGRAEAAVADSPVAGWPAAASPREALATKDFAAMDDEEQAAAAMLLAALAGAPPLRPLRRLEPRRYRGRVDVRRTLRQSARHGADPVPLAYRRAARRPRPVVLLCDISCSMAPYHRAYLQFFQLAVASGLRAEAFVFATRLTRMTPVLRTPGVDAALAAAGLRAPDWSGGTRIGAALAQFNDVFGRRGLARGAVVAIFSDGWERDDPAVVGREMARLGRLAHRVVWVNPRKAAPGYAPLTGGMAAALPSVDFFVCGHTVAALAEVIRAIAGCAARNDKAEVVA